MVWDVAQVASSLNLKDYVLAFFTLGQRASEVDEEQQQQILASYCQALLSTAEFRNLD